jgi:hypothetical protein
VSSSSNCPFLTDHKKAARNTRATAILIKRRRKRALILFELFGFVGLANINSANKALNDVHQRET